MDTTSCDELAELYPGLKVKVSKQDDLQGWSTFVTDTTSGVVLSSRMNFPDMEDALAWGRYEVTRFLDPEQIDWETRARKLAEEVATACLSYGNSGVGFPPPFLVVATAFSCCGTPEVEELLPVHVSAGFREIHELAKWFNALNQLANEAGHQGLATFLQEWKEHLWREPDGEK